MNALEQEVWFAVQKLNKSWTENNACDLRDYFHPEMVAITPYDKKRVIGRDACVASWERFVKSTEISNYREIDPKINIFGNSAVVTYYYEITFTSNGKRYCETGRDMFFMTKKDGQWLAVANQFSSTPEQ